MNKNLVLIGMPGSGKTTVGQLLSQRLDLPLVDTDWMVEREAGRSIPDIFAQDGEAGFRALETRAARQAAAREGIVIATGGGMVLREENMAALSASGVVFFLDRPPEAIVGGDHMGRPLLAADRKRVFQLYTQRILLYKKYAMHCIFNDTTAEDAAKRIAAIYLGECGR